MTIENRNISMNSNISIEQKKDMKAAVFLQENDFNINASDGLPEEFNLNDNEVLNNSANGAFPEVGNGLVDKNGLLLSNGAGTDYSEIKKDGYTPQGQTESENELIISAYKNGKKSRLYIYDKETKELIAVIVLPTDAHVGGAALDEEHSVLYVTDKSGKVKAYDYEALMKAMRRVKEKEPILNFSDDESEGKKTNTESIEIPCDINIRDYLDDENANSATCTYHDGCIYVATFDYTGKLVRFKLKYNDDGTITTEGEVFKDDLPIAVQGICFYTDPVTGEEYLITAQSYGGSNSSYGTKSCLKKYKITDDGHLEFVGQKEMDYYYAEGITCDEDGNITSVHENKWGSTDIVQETNINDLDEPWDQELEDHYKEGVDKFYE